VTPARVELSNGCVLLLHEDHASPTIAFRGSVRAGAAYGSPGLAEFAARLLLRGTARRTAAQVSDAIEDVGAALTAMNGMESAALEGRCTRETLKPILRILAECVSQPAFSPAELEKVRGEVLGDLREQQDDTRRAATRRLFELVYPESHPFHRDPKGDERSVKRMRRKDLRAFHEARWDSRGMIFAFSGDLDEETFRGPVADAFERLDGSRSPEPLPPPKPVPPRNALVPMPHKSQADFLAGRIAIPRRHPDYDALHLANVLFGRIGLYGRLGAKVRDDLGLAYYAFTSLEARHTAGHWYACAGVNPRNLEKAVAAIRSEMERLETEPFTDAEVADGKTNLVGSLQVTLERNAEYAAALHDLEYYGLGIDYLERYPRIVAGLDPEVVRKLAVRYFDPDACSWVAAGPVKDAAVAF